MGVIDPHTCPEVQTDKPAVFTSDAINGMTQNLIPKTAAMP